MLFNNLRRQLYLFQLRGDERFCPVCERGFEYFLPGGPSKRPDALCPNCQSLERHRFLWLMLKILWTDNSILSTGKMLHFAPEPCLTQKLKKSFKYLSADIDSRFAMVAMDITDIKFPEETFDVIICNHVLEHIPDDRKAMAELFRVLKKGGWASLQVPMRGERTYEDPTITSPEDRQKAFGQDDHVRWYGSDYYQRLREIGFDLRIYNKNDFFGKEENKRYALSTEEELVIVRRPST